MIKYMKLLSIYNEAENSILEQVSNPVQQTDWDSWLVKNIVWEMQRYSDIYPNSVWFSAIQFGYPLQIFYINCRPTPNFPWIENVFQAFVINPTVISMWEEKFNWYEWCMSIVDDNWTPTYRWRVDRSTSVRFSYLDIDWNFHENTELNWFTAVIFQHEYDHLLWKLINKVWYDMITNDEYLRRKSEW
jgi:peptide deformylase